MDQKKRGFASMNPEQRREIARAGGIASHQSGKAHKFTTEEARAAGRLGGLAAQKNKQEKNRE